MSVDCSFLEVSTVNVAKGLGNSKCGVAYSKDGKDATTENSRGRAGPAKANVAHM